MRTLTSNLLGVATLSAILSLGCATTQPATAQAPAPAEAAKLNDAQVAAVVVAANQVDIDAGELAMRQSTDAEVRKFAERMVTDHRSVNQAAVALVTKLGVTPEANATSQGLTQGGEQFRTRLAAMSGAEFDRAYIDNEVAYHQTVLDALDSTLIPSATNQELKDMLVGVRPAFVAHLEHAKSIQASVSGQGGTTSSHH